MSLLLFYVNGIPSCKGAREQRDIEKKVGSWSGTVLLLTVIIAATLTLLLSNLALALAHARARS